MGFLHFCSQAVSVIFEYDTPRVVHICSKKIGCFNRFLQLCIIGYVIGFAIIYKKGYQDFENVKSSVTTKVKGVVRTDINNQSVVLDSADYIVPSQENGALFVTTNLIRTQQSQSECPESTSVPRANCTRDADCPENLALEIGHGVLTGKCNKSTRTCMIYAWCPIESDHRPETPVLEGAKNFTIFIKNNIEFTKFGVKKRNLPENGTDAYLQNCAYTRNGSDNFCPIFVLDYIVTKTGSTFDSIANEGGVVEILIKWYCNLDHSVDDCIPVYEFHRLDSKDYKVSKGYNFRYAYFYNENDQKMRELTKAYGILFIINVMGKAGKFNIVPLLLNVGSGLALLSITTIICDIFVLYILKARHIYSKKKYLTVTAADAFKVLDEQPESTLETSETSHKMENSLN